MSVAKLGLLGLVLMTILGLCAGQAKAQEGPAPVTVSEDAGFFTLDNGLIRAMVSKASGDLVSMKFKGAEMLGTVLKEDGSIDFDYDPPGNPGRGRGMTDHMYGFWSHDTNGGRIETKVTINPASNGGARGEVSVKGYSDGKNLGFGPGAGAQGDFAADIEIRYTLNRGETGVYTYCTFEHKPEYPDASMGEARFCVKLNNGFDWMLVNEDHNLMYPRELEAAGDNKYNYTANQYDNPVFGWANFNQNVGFFFINASSEYLTGPPSKVEFLCHRDTTGPSYAPTILNYWRSSHYGGGSVDVAKGEHWTKVIGPFLLYANTGNSPQVIWADAQAQQKKEAGKWPYNWVSGVDYSADSRSTVTGKMVLQDPQKPGAKLSNLRVGLAHASYRVPIERPNDVNSPLDVHWGVDSKHYAFWTRGDATGAFTIPAVRAGTYTLHAYADGILGEFARADVKVEAGKPLDLGNVTWTPVRRGKQIWEIGVPNRTGEEYVKGRDHFHDGMATVYALLFPNDVNYVIGKSEPDKDWYFLHAPHASDAAIAAATVNAQPRPQRGGGGAFGGGAVGRGRGAATQPGARGGFARGGPATQPQGVEGVNIAGAGRAGPPAQGLPGARAGGRGPGARGGAPGAGAGPGGGSRPSPWAISFDMPNAPRGKATLRLGIATNNNGRIDVSVNGIQTTTLDGMYSESSIGRNANRGIWFEKEVPFDASMLKAGPNTLTLTLSSGAIIYDYLRLELDDAAN